MTFSLFSVILLLFIGTAVYVEVVRGYRHGFARAALSLAVAMLSIIGASIAAQAVADIIAEPLSVKLTDFITERVDVFGQYREQLPHLDELLMNVTDMLVSPLLFLAFFLVLRLLLRILVFAFYSGVDRPMPDDPRRHSNHMSFGTYFSPDYEGQETSWFRRHDRALGGAVGVVVGLMVAVCLLSPLVGTLNVVGTVYNGLEDAGLKWSQIKIDEEKLDTSVSPFIDDVMVHTVSSIGGQLIYDASATTRLYGQTIVLQDEVEACMRFAADANGVVSILGTGGTGEEQKDCLQTMGDHLGSSRIMCVVAADFVRGASERWLDNRTFFTVRRPNCGYFVDQLMNKVLLFLSDSADPNYVSMDMNTMLGIYFIALDQGLLSDPDVTLLMELMEDGTVLDQIYAELDKNPRMAYLVEELTNATMEIMAQSIASIDLLPSQYGAFMDELAEAVTLVNGMNGTDFPAKVNTMTDYAVHYAQQYNIALPTGVARMGITAMMEQFADRNDVTGDEMAAYIKYFLNQEGEDSEDSEAPSVSEAVMDTEDLLILTDALQP